MSISRDTAIIQAKQLAQNAAGGTGIQLLLTDPGDYQIAVAQATKRFDTDKPNRRIKDVTITTAGFRQVLAGTGAVLPTSGFDQWIRGASNVVDVFFPWDATSQGIAPLDRNDWQVVETPASSGAIPDEVIEFLQVTPAVGQVVRFVYTVPHIIDNSDPTLSTVRPAEVQAFVTLVAYWVLLTAAAKAIQNAGNTGLPNDIVDRRSQSEEFRRQAKLLLDQYQLLVGAASTEDLKGQSGFKDLDVPAGSGLGYLWHSTRGH